MAYKEIWLFGGDTMKVFGAIFAFIIAMMSNNANATAVIVDYAISGSPGSWVYNFSISNEIGNTNKIYFFGVVTPTGTNGSNIVGSPVEQQNAYWDYPWNFSPSHRLYNNLWWTSNGAGNPIANGSAMSGFSVVDSSIAPATSVQWMAFAIDGTDMNDDGHFGYFANPGFEGEASSSAVPEPTTWAMLLVGMGLVGAVLRQRRQAILRSDASTE